MSGGYDDGRNSETETAAGDGWDDADNWESFEVTPQKSSAKSTVCITELFCFPLLILLLLLSQNNNRLSACGCSGPVGRVLDS